MLPKAIISNIQHKTLTVQLVAWMFLSAVSSCVIKKCNVKAVTVSSPVWLLAATSLCGE